MCIVVEDYSRLAWVGAIVCSIAVQPSVTYYVKYVTHFQECGVITPLVSLPDLCRGWAILLKGEYDEKKVVSTGCIISSYCLCEHTACANINTVTTNCYLYRNTNLDSD